MASKITFFGDPHGDFSAFHQATASDRPDVAIFLGDMGLDRPFEEEIADYLKGGWGAWWIAGNHDTDSVEWHDRVFESEMFPYNLGNRVRDFGGVRIAGLGGVFRGNVWFPREGNEKARYETREDFNRINRHNKWRNDLPLRQRSTIFPEDFEKLSKLQADILVSHEAPSNHEFGFAAIDALAERMGVKMIIHGHHHKPYEATLANGISVVGVEKAGLYHLPSLEKRFTP